ncbi:MAG TPA: NUDIX hydrolase [Longimicrobiaceae bacterium]|nr:NUDIX hydrolase [Longimicrobiaceae bacterium]
MGERGGRSRGAGAAQAVVETSAGGVIYRWHGGAAHVLLIRDRYRHWGFPKGHLEGGETAADAALREVAEETGLCQLRLERRLRTIDWFFRFRGRLIHKYCHFYLIESPAGETCPQREEGITECVWLPLPQAIASISYDNAREVLRLAAECLEGVAAASSLEGGDAAP